MGVDTLEDGVLLRRSNVTSVRIVVLYWSDPWAAPVMIDNGIEPTVWDLGWIAAAEVRFRATVIFLPQPTPLHFWCLFDCVRSCGAEVACLNTFAVQIASIFGVSRERRQCHFWAILSNSTIRLYRPFLARLSSRLLFPDPFSLFWYARGKTALIASVGHSTLGVHIMVDSGLGR